MNSEYFKDIFSKLKKDKKSMVIVILGLMGVLLILLSEIGDDKSDKTAELNITTQITDETDMTAQLQKLIENIDGAGKTKVMLTFESYSESVYASDIHKSENADGDIDYSSEYIVVDSGTSQEGLLIKMTTPKIRGVAVVCQGGSNPVVKQQIVSAVSALFNISSNKISVAAMAK